MGRSTASLTTVDTSISLSVPLGGDNLNVSISGTYNMTLALQRATSPAQLAWETIKTWSTANATVNENFRVRNNADIFRIYAVAVTSGTAVVVLTNDAVSDDVNLPSVIMNGTMRGPTPYVIDTATFVIQPGEHAGRIGVLDRAAGIAVTLPAATGTGDEYQFVVKTTFTGDCTIKSLTGADIMIGYAFLQQDAGDTVVGFAALAASTFDTIDIFDASNVTGGFNGAYVRVRDIAVNRWFVEVFSDAAGTEATPFKDTVA